MIRYFKVWYDPPTSPEQRPIGLFRQRFDEDGKLIRAEAYHPAYDWNPTDYWLRTARGEPDDFLVEVDESEAAETIALFDHIYEQDPTMAHGL